jgi:rhamnose transport system permease protein
VALANALQLLARSLARLSSVLIPVIVLGVMIGINPALRFADTWAGMARNWIGEILLAFALTPIIITGGIDLSVGSVVGLSAVMAGFLWRVAGLPLELALAGGVLTGLAGGTVNGLLTLTGINPLVVTLATLGVFRGLAYGLSGIRLVDDFPAGFPDWWDGRFLWLPRPLWFIAVAFVLGYIGLHHTWMGRMLFAMGDNPRAARYAGVPVRSLTLAIYSLSGLVAGIVGLTAVLRSPAAPANLGEGLELNAIACVVLGGTRITGGAGHLAGTLLGAVTLMALVEGTFFIAGEWRPLATGAFLIAVAIANENLARLRVPG